MAGTSEATEVGAEAGAHFCKAPTPEELDQWKQHWRAEWAAAHPRLPPLPMRNVVLALDLVGDGIRPFEFQGQTYRLHPTSFAQGLSLQRVQEVLIELDAIGHLTGQAELSALRTCYAAIAEFGGALIVPKPPRNPFLAEGGQEDLQRLLGFLLQTGDETPQVDGEGTPIRWNAAHYLLAYEATFGAPTTWRKFCAGLRCLARLEAERTLQLHGAVWAAIAGAFGGEEMRQEWLSAQRGDAR